MARKAPSFSVLIRWRSARNPAWEIDTRHRGFRSAEEAAMIANGLGCAAFDTLVLERGELLTLALNGQRLPVEDEVAVWTLPAEPVDLPEDLQFERAEERPSVLSAKGLDGVFRPRRFRVLDDETGRDVIVRFTFCRSRLVVLVGGLKAQPQPDIAVPLA